MRNMVHQCHLRAIAVSSWQCRSAPPSVSTIAYCNEIEDFRSQCGHMPTNSFICYFLRENLETKQPPFDVRIEIDIGKNYEGRFKLITLRVTSSSVLSSAKTTLPISIAWHYSDFEVNYTTARLPIWRSIKAAQIQFQHYFMNR